jgi:L-2-hydroxyglutarate oxidase LhgO
MNQPRTYDLVIVGGGIIGLAIAYKLRDRDLRVCVVEKEPEPGSHASGRNSGVLHAGIYYTADSLKAKYCVEGNRQLQAFCRQKGIRINPCGKVIVTRSAAEVATLHELQQRAERNGATVRLLSARELQQTEPYAKTTEAALFSPNTVSVHPKDVINALQDEIAARPNTTLLLGTAVHGPEDGHTLRTSAGPLRYERLLNVAGAHSCTIAHRFGAGRDYVPVPFKGIYKLLQSTNGRPRAHIYPVPDLRNPFLGVHFTVAVDGTVHVGPTAMPALGPENYDLVRGVGRETPGILWHNLVLLFTNAGYRAIARTEPLKYIKEYFYRDARALVQSLRKSDLVPSKKVGIRAQLVDRRNNSLVSDFLVERRNGETHLLNAISPGFTCAFPLADHLIEAACGS